jgi:hypothetical protein
MLNVLFAIAFPPFSYVFDPQGTDTTPRVPGSIGRTGKNRNAKYHGPLADCLSFEGEVYD